SIVRPCADVVQVWGPDARGGWAGESRLDRVLFTPRANTIAASLITHTVWNALPLTLSQHLFSISTVGEVSPMNPVERVLHQELTGLLDRLATSVPAGG